MTVTFTNPPTLPSLSDPANFNDRALSLFSWLTGTFIPELEAVEGLVPDGGDFNVDSGTFFVDVSANKVGIGTTSPANVLDVNGDALIDGVTVGRGTGSISTNTAVGNDALRCNTTGNSNTATGNAALCCNTTGNSNTATGNGALLSNTTGSCNTASGVNALCSNTTGFCNTASGVGALSSNTEGYNNTAVGRSALRSNTTGYFNTAVGRDAISCNTTGCCNTASGRNALFSNTTGNSNTASGANALYSNTTGCNNTASGRDALVCNTTGYDNTASGVGALSSNTEGCNNTATGLNAILSNTTGSNNIGIGVNAGRTGGTPAGIVNITTQSNRIVMGNDDHTCAQIKIAWTATSDCRDKTCFKPLKHGLEFVRALKPTEYQFKQGGRDSTMTDGKRRYGFLAQDILPLEGDNPVIISDDDPEKLQYTESHLIPVLVKAIQELTARIEELENNA